MSCKFKRAFKLTKKIILSCSMFYLPNSGTSDVVHLAETSNINIPGKWLYMIGSQGITEPDSRLGGTKDRRVAWNGGAMLNDGPVRRSLPGENIKG